MVQHLKAASLKDFKKRELTKELEKKRKLYKFLTANRNIIISNSFLAELLLNTYGKNSSSTKLVNRCVITGRGKGIVKNLKISRITMKKLIGQGLFSNISKKTW